MDTPLPLVEIEPTGLIPGPTLHEQITAPLPVYLTGKRQRHSSIVRILAIAGLLLFLLASSILTYFIAFAGRETPVHPSANAVRSNNQQGQPTAPQMQLSTSYIDFGAEHTQNPLTLRNAGGQEVNWLARVDSNSSWLRITPTFGTLTKQKESATVTVDRSNLTPRIYTGYIYFFQQGTYNSLPLKVTMNVTTQPTTVTASPSPPPTIVTAGPSPLPAMTLSTIALAFSAIQGNNPAQQAFRLSNPGNAPLNWGLTENASPSTLLSLSPKSGTVAPGSTVSISVAPNVSASKAGVISATITIQDTDPGTTVQSQQVAVKITIINQALISVSPSSISCNLSSTTTSFTQQLQITNSGSATLDWAISQSLPAWVSIDTTSGSLPPGFTAFVNVACNNTGLQAGTQQSYTLVVSDTDAQTPVVSQNVQITLTVS
jgi:hypothetical protein